MEKAAVTTARRTRRAVHLAAAAILQMGHGEMTGGMIVFRCEASPTTARIAIFRTIKSTRRIARPKLCPQLTIWDVAVATSISPSVEAVLQHLISQLCLSFSTLSSISEAWMSCFAQLPTKLHQ